MPCKKSLARHPLNQGDRKPLIAILRVLPQRLAIMILTLFLVSVVIFSITQILPGDAAYTSLGQYASEEAVKKLRIELGLDTPVWNQYINWLAAFVRGDFRESLILGIPIRPILLQRLANSSVLGLLAFLEITCLGIFLGVLCGIKKDSLLDQTVSIFGFIWLSIPEFVSGSLFILFFAGTFWKIFPAGGYVAISEGFWPWISRLILPATTLTLILLAYVARMTRSSMIEVLRSNYVRTARLKGLDEKRVILRHALRNALMPTATLLANNFGWLMGGIVVVESVFSFPGLGRLTISAIHQRDIPMIQATVLVVAALYISANVAVDLLYMILDPRNRPD